MKISLYTGGMVQTNGYLAETPDGNFVVDAPEGITDWILAKGVRVDERIDVEAPIVSCGQPIRVAHVPGHSVDSITFYCKDEGVVFAGDTLFSSSVGRTDLPGGSTETLIAGIHKHLLTLPAETRVLSGHGPETTIGQEASTNPFL